MDSELILHYVVAKSARIREDNGLPEPPKNAWSFPDSALLLVTVQQWGKLNCVAHFGAWIQHGKDHTILAEFGDPNEAFAFKMRYG